MRPRTGVTLRRFALAALLAAAVVPRARRPGRAAAPAPTAIRRSMTVKQVRAATTCLLNVERRRHGRAAAAPQPRPRPRRPAPRARHGLAPLLRARLARGHRRSPSASAARATCAAPAARSSARTSPGAAAAWPPRARSSARGCGSPGHRANILAARGSARSASASSGAAGRRRSARRHVRGRVRAPLVGAPLRRSRSVGLRTDGGEVQRLATQHNRLRRGSARTASDRNRPPRAVVRASGDASGDDAATVARAAGAVVGDAFRRD